MFTSLRKKIKLLIKIIAVIFSINLERRKDKNEKKIKINNLSISYLKFGSRGNNLVFLHGWGQSKETWLEIADNLQTRNTVYLLDIPGFGKSSFPLKALTIAEYAKILDEFLKKLKINKFILIGHSFGGRIAAEFCLRYPNKIRKLIIYSTSLGFCENISGKILDFTLELSKTVLFIKIIKIYLKLRKKSYFRFTIMRDIFIKGRQNGKFRDKIKNIHKKILFLYGKFDFIAPYDNGVRAKRLVSNSKLIMFNKSSHLAHIEEKEKFLKELIEFAEN